MAKIGSLITDYKVFTCTNFISNCNTFIKIQYLCTYGLLHAKHGFNAMQQARLAKKFLSNEVHLKKKKNAEGQNLNSARSSISSYFKLETENFNYKINRLNKLFMEKITEIILMTKIFDEIAGKGFEITQVQVMKGLNAIHVYWHCSNSQHDEELNEILTSSSSFIRSELKINQITGTIPPILFVRDNTHKIAMEVDKRLQVADFGKDFEPAYPALFQGNLNISKEAPDLIGEDFNKVEEWELPKFPLMKYPSDKFPIQTNIFGVDRAKILDMVRKGCNASSAAHRKSRQESEDRGCRTRTELPKVELMSLHSRAAALKKWAAEYKRNRAKIKKRISNEENYSLSYISPEDTNDDLELNDEIYIEEEEEEEFEDFEDRS